MISSSSLHSVSEADIPERQKHRNALQMQSVHSTLVNTIVINGNIYKVPGSAFFNRTINR